MQFKYINQLDSTISPVYYLTFIYSSTCFGRSYAHHQFITLHLFTAQHVSGVLTPIISLLFYVYLQLNMFRASLCPSSVYYFTFIYSSTCFGRPYAHHQFITLHLFTAQHVSGVLTPIISLLLYVYLQLNMFRASLRPSSVRPRPTALLSPRSECKTRGCYRSC
jgi:hypothetical protein